MASEGIDDTDFTVSWVVEKLIADVGEEAANPKLSSWAVKPIGVGEGYLSKIFKLKLEWQTKNPKLPDSVVLKIASAAPLAERMKSKASSMTPEQMQQAGEMMMEFLVSTHATECHFYSVFNKQGLQNIPHVYFSHLHSREQPGIIIMDDLSDTAGIMDLATGLNKSQLLQVLDVIAAVNAYSLKNNQWQDTFKPMTKQQLATVPPMIMMAAEPLKMMNPDYFSQIEEQLLWIADIDYMFDVVTHSHTEVGIPAVLTHGDLWCNNLLYEKKSGQLKAVIDWQLVRPGNFAQDIVRLLASSCDPELRRAELESFLLYYANQLNGYLGYKHEDFTLEKMIKAYEAAYPFSMAFFVAGLPMYVGMVTGPEKERKIETLMRRAKCAVEDAVILKKKLGK